MSWSKERRREAGLGSGQEQGPRLPEACARVQILWVGIFKGTQQPGKTRDHSQNLDNKFQTEPDL